MSWREAHATSSSSSTTQPYSAYRFNAMRWDGTSGSYDMGFRNYDPGLNQFTSRDCTTVPRRTWA